MKSFISSLEKKALQNEPITSDEALTLMNLDESYFFTLIASADAIRQKFKGNKISLCSIVNARSGNCPENCAFCSQSVMSNSNVPIYDLMDKEEIFKAAGSAVKNGAKKFGIVTSGRGVGGKNDSKKIVEIIEELKQKVNVHRCASLGILSKEELLMLKEAGIHEYHHNLETSKSFFPEICTTHDYADNESTVRAAKEAGLRVCCGGIFGMGETSEQRVELAFALKELDVDSVPINFLNPVKGTRMESRELLNPKTALKIVATYRFILPDKDLKVAGGREVVLRDLQSLMFAAGANSTMLGNYLTTMGRKAEDDMKMIYDLGLEPA